MFGIIAIFIITGAINIWLLAGCSLVLGCMFAMMGPTRQAMVGDLLTGPQLAHGVALTQLMMNATRIIGPLVAGLLLSISIIGTGGVYVTMFCLFVIVCFVLFQMAPTAPRLVKDQKSVVGDLLDGARYIWNNREVRLLTITFAGIVLTGFSFQTLLPGYLENELGHKPNELGILFSVMAVGGIITTVIISSRRTLAPAWVTYAFAGALAGSLGLLAVAPSFVAALVVMVMIGATSSGFQMMNNVNLMQRASPEYFGRVMSVTMMAFGLNAICAFPIGLVADAVGERTALGVLAIGCAVVAAAGLLASTKVLVERPSIRTRKV